MNIIIKDIPEEGMELHADSRKEDWLCQVFVDSLSELFHKEDLGVADFHLLRTGKNVDCRGSVSFSIHPACCRCLKVFASRIAVPLHWTLAPLYENERQLKLEQKEEVGLVKEDLEFAFYEGDRFSLSDLIREQVILSIPLQPLCKNQCKGLCQYCGKDLNKGVCGCKEHHEDKRWEPLKAFKSKD